MVPRENTVGFTLPKAGSVVDVDSTQACFNLSDRQQKLMLNENNAEASGIKANPDVWLIKCC